MLDRVITQADLLMLVDELARKRRTIGPVARSIPAAVPPVRYFYEVVEKAERLDLGFSYAVHSPKRFLLPEHETLFEFRSGERSFSAQPIFDDRAVALVGVHPCDVNAIRLLDHVFSQPHRDEHYLIRRQNTMIIAVDCASPCTNGVFCEDMKANTADSGFDVMLIPLPPAARSGEDGHARYGVIFGTPAGREWILYGRRCEVPTAADERAFSEYRAAKTAAFQRALRTPFDDLPGLLGRSYDSLLWEATARRCYSCASCNLVCPTCYCFNIYDEVDLSLSSGQRLREWDGCQLRDFALVAGGHNFRPKAAARLRHRIFRKGRWIRERTGLTGCVGCARCDRACTAKISSVEIYNQLAEEV